MNLLSKLFRIKSPESSMPSGDPKTSGELVAEVTGGANLVEGKQTWELADNKKDDIDYMKKCCYAELKTMETADLVAAPYYFERVAILSRKIKNYEQEISFCERYMAAVEAYYQRHGIEGMADVRQGPRFQAIVKRLPKAKELLACERKAT